MADPIGTVKPLYDFSLSEQAMKCLEEAKQKLAILTHGYSVNKPIYNVYGGRLNVDNYELKPAPLHGEAGGSGGVALQLKPFIFGGGSQSITTTHPAFGALAADIVKPEYDKCMAGTPTFLPKKPGANAVPYP